MLRTQVAAEGVRGPQVLYFPQARPSVRKFLLGPQFGDGADEPQTSIPGAAADDVYKGRRTFDADRQRAATAGVLSWLCGRSSLSVDPKHVCLDVYMAAPQKHRACNRPGRPFCDKACNRIGGLATNPPCEKPIEDYSTLHRGPRQGFVTECPRQRYVTEGGGGTATNSHFEAQPYMYTHMYIYIYIYLCIYI